MKETLSIIKDQVTMTRYLKRKIKRIFTDTWKNKYYLRTEEVMSDNNDVIIKNRKKLNKNYISIQKSY